MHAQVRLADIEPGDFRWSGGLNKFELVISITLDADNAAWVGVSERGEIRAWDSSRAATVPVISRAADA